MQYLHKVIIYDDYIYEIISSYFVIKLFITEELSKLHIIFLNLSLYE